MDVNSDHRLDVSEAVRETPTSASSRAPRFYLFALGGACLLIVIGAYFVVTRTPVQPARTGTGAWGGTGAFPNTVYSPNATAPDQSTVGIMQSAQNSAPYTYILPSSQQNTSGTETSSDGFDFNAFIALLSHSNAAQGGTTATSSSGSSAYAFIPTGLVSMETPKARTKLQFALYTYGNDVGSLIQSFEQEHPNETQILTDQAQDRSDPGKAAALQGLAHGLSGLGDSLLSMDSVPSQMTSIHTAVANSYRNLGTKLALIAQTKSDADFLAAINTYNASAETFAKNYVGMADLFVSYGVTFTPNEPGSVFTFSPMTL